MASTEDQAIGIQSIEQFAYWRAGPQEFVICFLFNTIIPWLIFRGSETVSFAGGHSVVSVLTGITLILPTLTTFFGYLNGLKRRKSHLAIPFLDEKVAWKKQAALEGLITAAITCPVCVFSALLANWLFSDPIFSTWTAILGLGLFSGLLGYFLHIRAILNSASITQ